MNAATRTLVLLILLATIPRWTAAQDGVLTQELIQRVRAELSTDGHVRAMRNALTSTGIKDIAENRDILAGHNQKFSHRIKTKGVSNQKSSGRCWMFAGFNTIKPVVMKKVNVDSFEFSHIYLQFWDKLEKSNCFLEYMIAFRERDLLDREVVFLLKDPAPDGGYWENFADLVAKHGVIPKEAMAETASSESTRMLNHALARLLRRDAVQLRRIFNETGSVQEMRQAKESMLAGVYRVLAMNLGEPPTEFVWRYKVKDKDDEKEGEDSGEANEQADDDEKSDAEASDDYQVEQKWSPRRTFTPKSFYDEFIGLDLTTYFNISDDPIRPKGRHYEIQLTKSVWEGSNAHYANVDIKTLRKVAVAGLLDNRAIYFSADVSPDLDSKKGIMARNLYDYASVYGVEMGLTKKNRLLMRDSTVNHGMAFIGVDLKDGQPVKWLVENSWGSDRGEKGLWTMYDSWFRDNVYNVITHHDYLPADALEIYQQPPEKLPVWDPMW